MELVLFHNYATCENDTSFFFDPPQLSGEDTSGETREGAKTVERNKRRSTVLIAARTEKNASLAIVYFIVCAAWIS